MEVLRGNANRTVYIFYTAYVMLRLRMEIPVIKKCCAYLGVNHHEKSTWRRKSGGVYAFLDDWICIDVR